MDQFRILCLTLLFLSEQSCFISSAYAYRIEPAAIVFGGSTSSSSSSSSIATGVGNDNGNFLTTATAAAAALTAGNGCTWLPAATTTTVVSPENSKMKHQEQLFKLDCNIRKLNIDFWNYTFSPIQLSSTISLHVKCHSQLFFESVLNSSSQVFFQLGSLSSIQVEYCKIKTLPAGIWSRFSQLKSLEVHTYNGQWIGGNYGLEIDQHAFEGLVSLEKLDLSWNNVWSLSESRMFCPMRNTLKHLNLSYNKLTDVWDENGHSLKFLLAQSLDSSCELNVLAIVDLSHNTIRRIGRNSFIRMKHVSELRLDNNYIDEIEDSAFSPLSSLQILSLHSNRLVALPSSAFKSCTQLHTLYLQNNSLAVLSPTIFATLAQLTVLDLSRNKLTSVPIKDYIFSSLKMLLELRLSYNQLSYIDSNLFSNLHSLKTLQLDNNRIETIDPNAFTGLVSLQVLDLSRNSLKYVEASLFTQSSGSLRQVYMDYNLISTIDSGAFINCSQLADLGLAGNLLTLVPTAFESTESHLQALKTLDIGENKVTKVTADSFRALRSLYGLRLAGNQLTTLPPTFCSALGSLRVLNLAQNRIRTVSDSSFIGCNELRALRLDSNELEQLPTTLPPQLLWLNVSENHIKRADYRELPASVEWLDLSYNELISLGRNEQQVQQTDSRNPPLFAYHLRVIDASFNNLTRLDSSTVPPALETLRVNHNPLRSIAPNTFATATRLRRVELMGNVLEDLPMTALRLSANIKQLPEFFLGGGSELQCSCSMEWLTRINQLSSTTTNHNHQQQYLLPRIVDQESIQCKPLYSRSNTLVPLLQATSSDFLCPYQSVCFALCHCCGFNCDCENQCPDGCSCYHDAEWTTNIVSCSNLNLQQIPERIPMDATQLYLDGNTNLSASLVSHVFIGKKNLKALFLNNSRIETIRNKTFNGLKSLEVLHLDHNLLSALAGYEFEDVAVTLRELYLQNNLLRYVASGSFAKLTELRILRLDGNLLTTINIWELGSGSPSPMLGGQVRLASNPWSCDCEFVMSLTSFQDEMNVISDFGVATCTDEQQQQEERLDEEDMQELGAGADTGKTERLSTVCTAESDKNSTPDKDFDLQRLPSSNHVTITRRGDPRPIETEDTHGSNQLTAKSAGSSLEEQGEPATPVSPQSIWTWFLFSFITVSLIILTAGAIYRHEIYYWVRNHKGSSGHRRRLFCCLDLPTGGSSRGSREKVGRSSSLVISSPCIGSNNTEEDEKLFDAYFLYSKSDEEMLCQKLMPELEQLQIPGQEEESTSGHGGHMYRLCLHYRDLCCTGENSAEMMLTACDSSKRIVVILSRTFLHCELVNYEFRTTLQLVISKYAKKLVFILLPPLNEYNFPQLYPDFKANAFKHCMLDWMDKNFWGKFKALLPAIPASRNGIGGGRSLFQTSQRLNNNIQQQQQEFPYNQHNLQLLQSSDYYRNVIPYGNCSQEYSRNSLRFPKHQIPSICTSTTGQTLDSPTLNPPLYWSQQQQMQMSPQHRSSSGGPVAAAGINLVYPTSSQPSPKYFTFADNFRHHHQQQMAQSHDQPFVFTSGTGKRRSTNSNISNNNNGARKKASSGSSPYKPLLQDGGGGSANSSNVSGDSCISNSSTSRILPATSNSSTSSSSATEEHIYSTLDSPNSLLSSADAYHDQEPQFLQHHHHHQQQQCLRSPSKSKQSHQQHQHPCQSPSKDVYRQQQQPSQDGNGNNGNRTMYFV